MTIEFDLDRDLKMVADGMQYVAESLMRPLSKDCDENEHSDPTAYIEQMYTMLANMGISSAFIDVSTKPKEEGKAAKKQRKSNVRSLFFIERLAWGDCGMYLSTPMPLLGGAAVAATGTPEQKEKFLKRFTEGKPKWAGMAITEPGAGSDSAAIQTTAVLEGNEWVINGEKIFVTAGKRAVVDSEGFIVVWATVDRKAGRLGIKPFIVDHGTPGMTVVKCEHKHGIRCSDTAAINFDNCRIPKENLLGSAEVKTADPEGFKGAMATFDATRPPVAASACGVGRASLELLQEKLAEKGIKPRYGVNPNKLTSRERDLMMMEAKHKACWLLTLQAGWMADMGLPNNLEASVAKCKAGRDNVWICQKAVEMLGPEGYSRKIMIEKWMRDSKIGDIYEGTQNIQKLIVARRILNYSKADLS